MLHVYMQRFFLDPQAFDGTKVMIREADTIHQITKVMRMRTGDECILLDGSGLEYLCRLGDFSTREISAEIISKKKNENEPAVFVTLYQALPKKMELFEWVLQKGTEIGVSRFVPLVTERTERRELGKIERLRKILKEAAEQSGRGIVPELGKVVFLKNCSASSEEFSMALEPTAGASFTETLKKLSGTKKYSLYIGPEGGFTPGEIKNFEAQKIHACTLGPRILRTETAAIVGVGLVMSE